ncbi:hypothetical protein GCM10007415_29020 [Parapedobacter pyrenivorans]|uniref:Uncharacterized protein n=1 Tax=Parapedobacter pyrenivorans TaxID=1305674 RepID=A0A917HWI3_9SPHI|nr:contractile injection system tape measure protein [Parapedobacter pyrenivorans]GGG92434.1 hypothetical protein GCM10007415_29020 [Parapedobacter pyrenivorans]
MNQIAELYHLFDTQDESFAHKLYGRWDTFFEMHVLPIMESVIDAHEQSGMTIHLKRLEVDLGVINPDRFDEDFPVRLRERLEEALRDVLAADAPEVSYQRLTAEADDLEVLCHLLLHGSLPWHARGSQRSLKSLYTDVLKTYARQFKRFLQRYGHFTSLQERLAFQLRDEEIVQTIRLLVPADSAFICTYAHLVITKYRLIERPDTKQSDYRRAVWRIVLGYLLTDRGSYFDRKAFLKHTIGGLAAKYNVNYQTLVQLVTTQLDHYLSRQHKSIELLLILRELKAESMSSQGISPRQQLLTNLSSAERSRVFLRSLSEDAIHRIVYLIFPIEGDFVVAYAKTLTHAHRYGHLQGRVGSDFQQVKWQFIFPILLDDKGTGFNRRHFIKAVLIAIAAHYNLQWQEILTYLYGVLDQLHVPNSLRIALDTLQAETHAKPPPAEAARAEAVTWLAELMRQYAATRELRADAVSELKVILANRDKRQSLLDRLTEEQDSVLLRLLYPSAATYVIACAQALDHHHEKAGLLQGKAGGEFRRLKWGFIFAVLIEQADSAFNREQFTYAILHRIAAHYNLYTAELLEYLYGALAGSSNELLRPLADIIHRLYDREQLKKRKVPLIATGKIPAEVSVVEEWLKWFKQAFRALWRVDFNDEELLRSQWSALPEGHPSRRDHMQLLRWLWLFSIRKLTETELAQLQHYHIRLRRMAPTFMKPLIYAFANTKKQLAFSWRESEIEPAPPERPKRESERPLSEPLFDLHGAGLVLLSPFLPRLVNMLELVVANRFASHESALRAVFVLQYLATGNAEAEEHELPLMKLLAGLPVTTAVPMAIELNDAEIATIDSLINGALGHWEKMKHTTPAGFREAFLCRRGKLVETAETYELTVEEQTYDVLIDSVPWQFRNIRYPWMAKPMIVHWR